MTISKIQILLLNSLSAKEQSVNFILQSLPNNYIAGKYFSFLVSISDKSNY